MILSSIKGAPVVQADGYRLAFQKDRPFAVLTHPDDEREYLPGKCQGDCIAELFLLPSIHPLHGRDDSYAFTSWQTRETPEFIEVFAESKSSVWKSKAIRLRCFPNRFVYEVEVEGEGALVEVNYFGGYYSGDLKWGSGFLWSGQNFSELFFPEPSIDENFHGPASATVKIDLMGVNLPGKGDWFFTPPPFCYAARNTHGGWLSMGVEPRPGENLFTEYLYHGSPGAFYLSLSYEGHTCVSERYTLPAIAFEFVESDYAALEAHVASLRRQGYAPAVQPPQRPEWWYAPIFCGWGTQCYQAKVHQGVGPEYSRQELYEESLRILEQNEISPGIVVIDDKWQADYGNNRVDTEKWPDLRGFIDRCHASGKKVLLWLKAWDPEGVPESECILNAGGVKVAVDPTSPAYEHRLREAIHHMLSEEGYAADGFKLDFTARVPSGPGLVGHEPVWGLELMRRFLAILYSQAKRTKPEALMMTHTPHSYLADLVDMIRLNDINIEKNVNQAMQHRARVAAIACPEAIIDTDNWPIPNKEVWRAYLQIQPELGTPSLYFATHIDRTQEPLDAEDYALIRQAWEQHRSRRARNGS